MPFDAILCNKPGNPLRCGGNGLKANEIESHIRQRSGIKSQNCDKKGNTAVFKVIYMSTETAVGAS